MLYNHHHYPFLELPHPKQELHTKFLSSSACLFCLFSDQKKLLIPGALRRHRRTNIYAMCSLLDLV